jgi:hypothetical protein
MILTAITLQAKVAIDKSSANDLSTFSHQNTQAGSASTNGYSRRKCSVNIYAALKQIWHTVHEVLIQDRNGEMYSVQALIDCGTTSIILPPRLHK